MGSWEGGGQTDKSMTFFIFLVIRIFYRGYPIVSRVGVSQMRQNSTYLILHEQLGVHS